MHMRIRDQHPTEKSNFGYICTECHFVTNHSYPGYAMDEVRSHCLVTGHLVKAGVDI